MTTFQRLELLVAVAKRLNITQVSRELHVSQSAVSQDIKKLEKNLGVKLIRKKRRGIELTEAGTALRMETEVFMERLDDLRKKYGAGISSMVIIILGASADLITLLAENW
jgi:DNA-binding transcriptional LysR family regulator